MKRLLGNAVVSLVATGALVAGTLAFGGVAMADNGTVGACTADYSVKASTGSHHGATSVGAVLAVKGLSEGATVTVKDASGTALKFQEPHKPATDSITAGQSGAMGHLNLVTGKDSVAGEHALAVTVTPKGGSAKTCSLKVSTTALLTAMKAGNSLSAGQVPAGFLVNNLPEGAVLTSIKVGGSVYWSGKAAAKVTKGEGIASVTSGLKALPNTPGALITATAVDKDGKAVTVASTLNVSRSTADVHAGLYGAKCVPAMATGGKAAGQGLFESALNPKTNKLFVTYAPFDSDKAGIARLDGTTLAQELFHQAEGVTAADGKAKNESGQEFGSEAEHKAGKKVKSGGYYKPFGIALDNTRGYVWVSNSITDTVSLYKQSDLSLVNRWPVGSLNHGYDLIIPDEKTGIAYATDGRHNKLEVFNPTTKAHETITVGDAAHPFVSMTAMALDDHGNLYLVSRLTSWGLKFNYATRKQSYFALGTKAVNNLGVAYDTKHHLLYVASQDTSMITVVDPEQNQVVTTIPVTAQPLRLAFDPSHNYMHVISRSGGTLATIDTDTNKVIAQRALSPNPNHLTIPVNGVMYYVDKNPKGNQICRIVVPAVPAKAAGPQLAATGSTTLVLSLCAALLIGLGLSVVVTRRKQVAALR